MTPRRLRLTQRLRASRHAVPIGLFVAIGTWLFAAALLVDLEYYDGYSAICNARYFLGLHDRYIGDRMPMMSIVLLPAEWWKTARGLHPLEVRPHHLTLAALHTIYLISVYFALVRFFGSARSTLIAFVAAVPNYMFFSYAPFLSHDLLPGAALLWMLIWSEEYRRSRKRSTWFALVALGTAAALFKQTYAIFWIIVLLVHAIAIVAADSDRQRRTLPALWRLGAAAAVSGGITWVVLGCVFTTCAPDAPLLARPLVHLRYVANVHAGKNLEFPIWIYVRNFPAYGWLVTGLIVPGMMASFRGSHLQRIVAAGWLLGFAAMHVVHLREVRYIAFLAPLSAFVIVPAVRNLLRSKVLAVLAVAALAGDAARIGPEAARIADTFYRKNPVKQFLKPLGGQAALRRPVIANTPMFSFVAPRPTPLAADRYHRIFNFGLHHMALLYGYEPADVVLVGRRQFPGALAGLPANSVVLFSSTILARGPSPWPGPPEGMDSFVQFAAITDILALDRRPDGTFASSTGNRLRIELPSKASEDVLLRGNLSESIWKNCPVGFLTLKRDGTVHQLRPVDGSTCRVIARDGAAALAQSLSEEQHLVVRRFIRQPDSLEAGE